MNKWKKIAVFFLMSLPLLANAERGAIKSVRVVETDSVTQLIFLLAPSSASPKLFSLDHPNRIVLDFPDTRLNGNVKKLQFSDSSIKTIRVGYPKPAVVRIVLNTTTSPRYKTTRRESEFILEIPKLTSSKPPPIKKLIIVLDPGHGGKDTGAIGERGVREKDIVLAIAKELAKLINRDPSMRVELTRSGDYFIQLRERLKLARKGKADLFIAIHADSYFTDRASGASVYALSSKGATNEAARWLARRDNYSELGDVNLGELQDQSIELRSVLLDLAQTETTKDSLTLGRKILDELDNVTRLHHERVEQAPFVVLKSPDIPSILVETGYLSNPKEALRLRDPRYQQKIAQALFLGVQNYFKNKR